MPVGLREKVLLLLVGGVLIVGATMLYLVDAIEERVKQELTLHTALRYVQFQKEKTLGGIQADLALALKMADTEVIRQWVRHPDDRAATASALTELKSLIARFSTHTAFIGAKPSSSFYFLDQNLLDKTTPENLKPTQRLDSHKKDDEWFFGTLKQSDAYNFNVDHNEQLQMTKLWINVLMLDGEERIGVVGTGIDITAFIEGFVKSGEHGITGMFITADGTIQGHGDASLIALNSPVGSEQAHSTIWKMLPQESDHVALKAALKRVGSGDQNTIAVPLTIDGKRQMAAVAYLAPLKWFAIAVIDVDAVVGSGQFRPLVTLLLVLLALGGGLVLGGANRFVVQPLRRIAEATRRVAEGDYSVRLQENRHDELGDLAAAFNRMAATLVHSQRLVQINAPAISTALQRAGNASELAQVFFSHVASLIDLGQGSFYRVDGDRQTLHLCGGYGRVPETAPPAEIPFGSGLLGQCAMDRQPIVIEHPPHDYIRVASVLGTATPARILLQPIIAADKLLGVLELSLLKPLDEVGEALIDTLLPVLAMCLEIISRNEHNERLLAATRKQAEALEAQQTRIQSLLAEQDAIFDNAPMGIFYTAAGKVQRANPAMARLYGISTEAFKGVEASGLFVSMDSYREFGALVGPRLGAGEGIQEEWPQVRSDGQIFTAMIAAKGVRIEGLEHASIWIVEDITERKAMEVAMRDNEERMRQILELAPIGCSINTIDGKPVFRNRRLAELLGYSLEELADLNVARDWFNPDDRLPFVEALKRDGHVVDLKARFVRADGTPITILINASIEELFGSQHIVTWSYDITQRDTAELAMRQINAEQTAMFEAALMGIAFIRNRIIVRSNSMLDRLFGTEPGEHVGKPTRSWYADEAAYQAGGDQVYAELAQGRVSQREQELVRKDGSRFWCRLSGTAVDASDLSRGTVWMLEDVTRAREATQAMVQAREIAEEAARTKSDFLANMSHEIRTPMNAIIGMAHLVLKTDMTPRQRDYVKKIHNSGQHLLGIINDILDFSKIEAGKLNVEHVDFELDKLLDNVANLVSEKTSAKGLELVFDIAPDVPRNLVGDSLRMGQVLINYANNAVKFTEKGEIDILMKVKERTEKEVLLWCAVRDTGIGLSEEQMGRLFQSFQQADTSTTRKYGGTGLGLSISKKLAELMSGEVGVDSVLGEGSTFWFTARLGIGTAKARNLVPEPDLRGRQVLVVDDNENARLVLADLLSGMTFKVSEVGAGTAAVGWVRDKTGTPEAPEIVFLDWQMPGMDGIEAARQIRSLGLEKTPHLIMVTAYGREEVMKQAQEVGIEDVLIKPVNASLLFDTSMRVLGAEVREHRSAGDAPSSLLEEMALIKGARILLVEDNDLNQEVASEILRDAGFEVEIADNGQIAVDKVKQNAGNLYDIVLMDMQMPVMDGVTSATEIRKDARFREMPIVAMTANAMQQDKDKCLAAGMVDFVTKPIQPDELWAALKRWITPKHAIEKLPAAPAATPATISPAPTLSRKISPKKAKVLSAVVDPVKLKEVCGQLAALLADDDSEAGDLFADNSDLLHAAFPNDYRAIDDSIRSFDLDTALERLKTAAAAAGVEIAP